MFVGINMDTVNNIDESIADMILKMVMEEGGIKRSELRTEYICCVPQYNKEFDRILDELVSLKKLIELKYIIDESERSFILPGTSKPDFVGESWQMNLGNSN